VDYDAINAFTLDHHRQEEIYDHQGRRWVNDSKATNLDAAIQAVKTYEDRFIHLIVGGNDKGADLSPLFELIANKEVHLYTIGANSDKLAKLAKAFHITFTPCKTLENAINTIAQTLTPDQVALLSPAAASFDQFNSYQHRGEEFLKFVKNIK